MLEFSYSIGVPQAPSAAGLAYGQGPARLWFDLYSSDLNPGRYLESWLPANMPWDRHPVHLGLGLEGAGVEHTLLSNAEVEPLDVNVWQLEWPSTTAAMDPMIVIKPSEELSVASGVHMAINGQEHRVRGMDRRQLVQATGNLRGEHARLESTRSCSRPANSRTRA